jgi:hypothetical protein
MAVQRFVMAKSAQSPMRVLAANGIDSTLRCLFDANARVLRAQKLIAGSASVTGNSGKDIIFARQGSPPMFFALMRGSTGQWLTPYNYHVNEYRTNVGWLGVIQRSGAVAYTYYDRIRLLNLEYPLATTTSFRYLVTRNPA